MRGRPPGVRDVDDCELWRIERNDRAKLVAHGIRLVSAESLALRRGLTDYEVRRHGKTLLIVRFGEVAYDAEQQEYRRARASAKSGVHRHTRPRGRDARHDGLR